MTALILEAACLKVLCEKDKEKLIAAKLPWSLYEKLQQMIAELTSLQDLMDLAVTAERFMAEEPEYFTETEMVKKARINSEKLRKMMSRKEVMFNSNYELPESGREKFKALNKIMNRIRVYGRKAFADEPLRRSAYTVQ